MDKGFASGRCFLALLVVGLLQFPAAAALQLLTPINPELGTSAGGAGDSWAPVVSPDGRFVLFASTANNLTRLPGGQLIPSLIPPRVNVYLRDRLNGTTTLVSVNLAGTGGGDGDSWPAGLSTNGQYALFESGASDLVEDDINDVNDVFVRDLGAGVTRLVSVTPGGVSGDGVSRGAMMTPDGRYVAFSSEASDLVVGDTNGIADVFVRDMQMGTTVLASPGATYGGAFAQSKDPEITPNGRYVAFYSSAIGLVPGVTTAGEIYVRDLVAGTTTLASTNARALSGLGSGATCCSQAISDDGQFIAYQINSTNAAATNGYIFRYHRQNGLTDVISTNGALPLGPNAEIRSLDMSPDGRFIAYNANSGDATCVYLWDSETGSNTLASANLSDGVTGGSSVWWPDVDATGRHVVFYSSATDLTTNGSAGLFVRDVEADTTALINVDTNGSNLPVSSTAVPAVSGDCSFVAFEASSASGDGRSRYRNVFGRDLGSATSVLISAHAPDLESVTPNGFSELWPGSMSTNARYVAFSSWADNLVLNDTNGCADIFMRDVVAGTNRLVSAGIGGYSADASSAEPSISGDGRYVAFASLATNLVSGFNSTLYWQIYVRDLQSETNTLVSTTISSQPAQDNCHSPSVGPDGRYVLFCTKSGSIAVGTASLTDNLYLWDRQQTNALYKTIWLTRGDLPVRSYDMTPDGHYVAFVGSVGADVNLYVWDLQAGARIYTNAAVSPTNVVISANGRRVAYTTSTNLEASDVGLGTNWLIARGIDPARAKFKFSDDGQFLVYATAVAEVPDDTNGTSDVYLYDFQSETNRLISRSFDGAGAADGAADSPAISPDGRFVAYRSWADNSVPGDGNGMPDVFVYDRQTGATILVTVSQSGDGVADNGSLTPMFSRDGHTLVFASWAGDLTGRDFNQFGDLFALDLSEFESVPNPTNPPPVGVAEIVFVPGGGSGGVEPGPVISWPFAPGASYSVEYKDNLSDAAWQPLDGSVTVVGSRAYVTDNAPAAGHRFYRVLLNVSSSSP